MTTITDTADTAAARDVLVTLRSLGYSIRVEGDELVITGTLSENLRAAITATKPAIVSILREEDPAILAQRLEKGAAMLAAMEPCHDLHGTYGKALYQFERLLARYEARDEVPA